jgi:large subunit ribosomal protein L21
MSQYAVIKTGGQQFLVKQGDELTVQKLETEAKKKIEFSTLARFDSEKKDIEIGMPFLKTKTEGEVLEHFKGEKIRVAKFKSKVRYRRVKGFRPRLTKIKIIKI